MTDSAPPPVVEATSAPIEEIATPVEPAPVATPQTETVPRIELPSEAVGEIPSFDQEEPSVADSGGFPSLTDAPQTTAAPMIDTATQTPQPAVPATSETPAPAQSPSSEEDQKKSVYDGVYSSRRGKLIPNAVFQAWLSYTILLTGGLAIMLYTSLGTETSQLESLPDPADIYNLDLRIKQLENSVSRSDKKKLQELQAVKNKFAKRRYVQIDFKMPSGHLLELGQTKRYGNIEVTPEAVVQGNLKFRDQFHDAAEPVLKLKLHFKNVSKDQTIAPLDDDLMYPAYSRNRDNITQFVCKTSEKKKNGNVVEVHYGGHGGGIKGQNLGKKLAPGEEVTIFIPCDSRDVEKLTGDLIWRVHFRKGYSPSKLGVTTVVEVKFHSKAIKQESSSA